MVFYSRIFVVRGAACFDSLCVHSGCPFGLHPGSCWVHHNYSVPSAHPYSSQSDWGSHAPTTGPGSHPSFPLSHITLAAELGFGLASSHYAPALLALWALAPGLEIFHVRLESPEDHLPCAWLLHTSQAHITRHGPNHFSDESCARDSPLDTAGSAQLPSLCFLCPPRCCFLPAPPPLWSLVAGIAKVRVYSSNATPRHAHHPSVCVDEADMGMEECSRKAGIWGTGQVGTRGVRTHSTRFNRESLPKYNRQ